MPDISGPKGGADQAWEGGRTREMLGAFLLPELGVFDEGVIAVDAAEDEAGDAVAKASFEEIHFDEHADGAGEEAEGVSAAGFGGVTLSHESGVTLHFAEGGGDGGPGILEGVFAQMSELAPEIVAFVDEFVAVTEVGAVKELGLAVIGIPAAAANPAAKKIIFAGDVISLALGSGGDAADFGGEFGSATFIAIDAEDPIVGGGVDGEVAKFAEAFEFGGDDFGAVFAGDFDGAIGAEGIDKDEFIGPFDGLKNFADLGAFVKGKDVSGDGLGVGRHFQAGMARERRKASILGRTISGVSVLRQLIWAQALSLHGRRQGIGWERMSLCSHQGLQRVSLEGPKKAMTGAPTAAARCMGAESTPRKKAARSLKAPS